MTEIILVIFTMTAVASAFNFFAIHSVFSCPVGTTMSSMPESKDSPRQVISLSLLLGSLMAILTAMLLAVMSKRPGASEEVRMVLIFASLITIWAAGLLGGIVGNNAYGRKREEIKAERTKG